MRNALFVAFMLTVFAGAMAAQVPNGNIYFGYTYYNTDLSLNRGDLNGFQATLEGKLVPVLGIVADITGHYGSLNYSVLCSLCTAPTTASANAHHMKPCSDRAFRFLLASSVPSRNLRLASDT